jgi:hypothetical protein
MLETFVGPCPDGKECCHRDDIRTHNFLGNLYWGTSLDNRKDAIRNGKRNSEGNSITHHKGEKNHNAKLTEKDVLRIRKICKQEILGIKSQLAREYGVTPTLITQIVQGKCWKYLL